MKKTILVILFISSDHVHNCLAAHIFSNSDAVALKTCRLEDCSGTAKYCEMFDSFFYYVCTGCLMSFQSRSTLKLLWISTWNCWAKWQSISWRLVFKDPTPPSPGLTPTFLNISRRSRSFEICREVSRLCRKMLRNVEINPKNVEICREMSWNVEIGWDLFRNIEICR